MASQCEVLVDTFEAGLADRILAAVQTEAERIEQKFSRYRTDNIVHAINSSANSFVKVDSETSHLIDFAQHCFTISDGLFDVTSGSLRRIWNFKTFKDFPSPTQIKEALRMVGFEKLKWEKPFIKLKKGMEIDFGGLGKEYAVDRCLGIARAQTAYAVLVNFGGDLAAHKVPREGSWSVGIENNLKEKLGDSLLGLRSGALATSGDTYRFFEHQGRRYSHILNPKTGLPVSNGVASVTVHAPSCTMAGLLATISHLHKSPEEFLKEQNVPHWIVYHKH